MVTVCGLDADRALDAIIDCVNLVRGPTLLVFPADFVVLDSLAALARLRTTLDEHLATRHPTILFGASIPDAAPPPGPLCPDADIDPWIPVFCALRHRARGWVWSFERQRASHPGQRLGIGRPHRRVVEVEGERLGLLIGAEDAICSDVVADAEVVAHLTPGSVTVSGGFCSFVHARSEKQSIGIDRLRRNR